MTIFHPLICMMLTRKLRLLLSCKFGVKFAVMFAAVEIDVGTVGTAKVEQSLAFSCRCFSLCQDVSSSVLHLFSSVFVGEVQGAT